MQENEESLYLDMEIWLVVLTPQVFFAGLEPDVDVRSIL